MSKVIVAIGFTMSVALFATTGFAAESGAMNPCAKHNPCEKPNPCAKHNPCEKPNPCAKHNPCEKHNPCAKHDPK